MTTKYQLTDSEKKVTQSMSKWQMMKLIHKIPKMYNRLCQNCKLKVHANPRRPLQDYCENCQVIIKETLEPMVK